MFLKNLKLTNFRNYPSLDFEFKSPITILYGDNAQGKTNFLESIYFLATTKSPRADREEELIKAGEEVVRVEGSVVSFLESNQGSITNQEIDSGSDVRNDKKNDEIAASPTPRNDKETEDTTKLEIVMQLQEGNSLQKRIRVNGIPRRVIDYSGNLVVVFFAPEDINLVTGSPSLRRNHIDQTISQIDRSYKKAISDYENVITRKNKVLKAIRDGFASVDQLIFWTDQQILLGALVTKKRIEFFNFLNTAGKKFGNFKFEYLESVLDSDRLKECQSREIDSASSLIGPHRDDFKFLRIVIPAQAGIQDNNRSPIRVGDDNIVDLSKFGSRGEQRTAVLDLKLAEVAFIESKIGNRPVLLLDDIFSELDQDHRAHVVAVSKLQQTIIATVEFNNYLEGQYRDARVYVVKAGEIDKKSSDYLSLV